MGSNDIWGLAQDLADDEFFSNLPEQADDFEDEISEETIAPVPRKRKKSRKKGHERLCRKCNKPIDNANYFFCSMCHHTVEDTESQYVFHF